MRFKDGSINGVRMSWESNVCEMVTPSLLTIRFSYQACYIPGDSSGTSNAMKTRYQDDLKTI